MGRIFSTKARAAIGSPCASATRAKPASAPGSAVTIDVLLNDADANGDALSISIDGQPANGTATVVNGKIVYTPKAGFTGIDSISYIISDGKGGTATATVTISVGVGPLSNPLYLPLIKR